MVNLLRQYTMFLHHLVGDRSGHYVEVRRIAAELNNHQHIFEALDTRQIALLLRQIFMDACRFFLVGINVRGNLPQSLLLQATYNKVAEGIIKAHLNVPYAWVKTLGNHPTALKPDQEEVELPRSPGRSEKSPRLLKRSYMGPDPSTPP
jgi:hypothetical protein